jgi:hypothetical protein
MRFEGFSIGGRNVAIDKPPGISFARFDIQGHGFGAVQSISIYVHSGQGVT